MPLLIFLIYMIMLSAWKLRKKTIGLLIVMLGFAMLTSMAIGGIILIIIGFLLILKL